MIDVEFFLNELVKREGGCVACVVIAVGDDVDNDVDKGITFVAMR